MGEFGDMDLMSGSDAIVSQSPLVTAPSSPMMSRVRSKRHRSDVGSSSDSGIVTDDMDGRLSADVIRQMNLPHERTQQQLERSHGAERMLISAKIQDFVAQQKSSFSAQSRS